eukprot:2638315-Rhodomonas_salina.1
MGGDQGNHEACIWCDPQWMGWCGVETARWREGDMCCVWDVSMCGVRRCVDVCMCVSVSLSGSVCVRSLSLCVPGLSVRVCLIARRRLAL